MWFALVIIYVVFLVGVVLKTIKMEGQDLRMRQSGLDLEYLKSVPGLLKIIEIVCKTICFEIGDIILYSSL